MTTATPHAQRASPRGAAHSGAGAGSGPVPSKTFVGRPGLAGSSEGRAANGTIFRRRADGTLLDVHEPRRGIEIHRGLNGDWRFAINRPRSLAHRRRSWQRRHMCSSAISSNAVNLHTAATTSTAGSTIGSIGATLPRGVGFGRGVRTGALLSARLLRLGVHLPASEIGALCLGLGLQSVGGSVCVLFCALSGVCWPLPWGFTDYLIRRMILQAVLYGRTAERRGGAGRSAHPHT